jgi:peptidoglycan/xylan/chitin deacetylase (PgdA/CDA1 family)
MLAATALCLSVVVLSSAHLGRHFGVVGADFMRNITFPGLGGQSPKSNTATLAEAGLLQPSTDPVPLPAIATPSPDPSPALLPSSLLSPSPTIISRAPLRSGLWVPILMYHYIRTSPDLAGVGLSVLPVAFKAQMNYLKDNGYTTITMRDLDRALLTGAKLPPKPVALTFDDGYVDFDTVAVPQLEELGMTATNYVPTMLVGRNNYMTWTQIETLDSEGFEMAAHSQFHVDVSKVSASRAEVEIFGAKSDLENHLGHEVVDWAYPYGGYNFTTVQLVDRAGYWSAVTTRGGGWHDRIQMPLLRRVRVDGRESLAQFDASLKPN